MQKNIFISIVLLIFSMSVFAQPKQLPNSKIYWEIVSENGDSTLKLTGEGRMPVGDKPWMRTEIKHADVSEGITSITCFRRCKQLISVNLPQSLRYIYHTVFENDTALRYINFPDAVDTIEYMAFYQTKLADTLHLPKHLKYIGYCAFTLTHITHVELPFLIDSIRHAFTYDYYLQSILLPAGLKSLCGTFRNDTAVRYIVNLSTQPQTFYFDISDNRHTFSAVKRSQCRLIVPTSAVETYKNTPVWKDFMIEGGGLSVGVKLNKKGKGDIEGLENRFYKEGEKVSLKAIPRGQSTFSGWKSPSGKLISTANPLVFTVTQDTMLTACFDENVSIKEAGNVGRISDEVTLYPNPSQEWLHVQTEGLVEQVDVFDLSGRRLLQSENADKLNISVLPKGIYLVRVRMEKGECMKKLVKE